MFWRELGIVYQLISLYRYNEINNYDFVSGTSKGGVIGHFTQMVWKSSTKVGYGVAEAPSPKYSSWGGKIVFVVAKYQSPGNMYGAYTQNVNPLISTGKIHAVIMLCSEKCLKVLFL